jgi:small subunit ribosomal protein S17
MSPEQNQSGRRTLTGRVVSNKMDKTVIVEVVRRVAHREYGKIVNRSRRFAAHDADNACQLDDLVVIQESRPLSHTKRWIVVERHPATTGA